MSKEKLQKEADNLTDEASKKAKGSLDQLFLFKQAAAILNMLERIKAELEKAAAEALKWALIIEKKIKAKLDAQIKQKQDEEKKKKELEEQNRRVMNFANQTRDTALDNSVKQSTIVTKKKRLYHDNTDLDMSHALLQVKAVKKQSEEISSPSYKPTTFKPKSS